MNTKLLGMAVAVSLHAPIATNAQSLMIYGRLYPESMAIRTSGATAPRTTVSTLVGAPTGDNMATSYAMEASNSRWGIRGSEALGGGLSAFFQIEQVASVDSGGGISASRETFAGIGSEKWGTVRLGYLDTVYRTIGDTLPFLGVVSGNFVSSNFILSRPGNGTNNAGSFHLRRGNSVHYVTPGINGFQMLATYSPDEAKSATRNADLWSIGGKYDSGPWYAAIAWERHNDFFGGSLTSRAALRNNADPNAHARDDAVRGTLQYRFGSHTLEGNVAQLDYNEWGGQSGRFERYKHVAWNVALESTWSDAVRSAITYAHAAKGSCSLIGDAFDCSADGLQGDMLAIGGAYHFSKRTYIFALYARLWNGKSAVYNNTMNYIPAIGADIDQLAIGIAHNF